MCRACPGRDASPIIVADGRTETDRLLVPGKKRGSQVPFTNCRGEANLVQRGHGEAGGEEDEGREQEALGLTSAHHPHIQCEHPPSISLSSPPSGFARVRSANHLFGPYRLLPSKLFLQLVGWCCRWSLEELDQLFEEAKLVGLSIWSISCSIFFSLFPVRPEGNNTLPRTGSGMPLCRGGNKIPWEWN